MTIDPDTLNWIDRLVADGVLEPTGQTRAGLPVYRQTAESGHLAYDFTDPLDPETYERCDDGRPSIAVTIMAIRETTRANPRRG